jgi:hypothetical protein
MSGNWGKTGKNLRGSSVAGCGRWLAFQKGVKPVFAMIEVPPEGRARMKGHFICGCAWTCESCATANAAKVRGWLIHSLYPALDEHGLGGSLMTLTAAHTYDEDWSLVTWTITEAYKLFDRRCSKIYAEVGSVGKMKAAEVVIGRNGLHFHLHILVTHYKPWPADVIGQELDMVPQEGDRWLTNVEFFKLQMKLEAAWSQALSDVGGSCNEHGFDFQRNRLDTYLAKISAAHEVAAQSTKKAKKKGRSLGQLLDAAAHSRDETAGAEWLRAIEALGRSRRFHAGSMPEKLGIPTPSEWDDEERIRLEELAVTEAENASEPVPVSTFIQYAIDDHIKATHPGLGRPGLAMILRAAKRGGEPSVLLMVAALCARYDEKMKPFWMRCGDSFEDAEPWAVEPDIIKKARAGPLSFEEVAEYLRVKRGWAPTPGYGEKVDDIELDSGVVCEGVDCPF